MNTIFKAKGAQIYDGEKAVVVSNDHQQHTTNKQILRENQTDTTNFLQVLEQTVKTRQQKTFSTWFDDKGKATNSYTFIELWNEAGAIANILRKDWKVEKGERVILCYNFGLQFFAAFLGCLRAGVTAVLVYPPAPGNLVKSLSKLTKVANDCEAKFILIDNDVNTLKKVDRSNPFSKSRNLWPKSVEFKLHPKPEIKKLLTLKEQFYIMEEVEADDLAFLQYTSGSTGDPKGVMVTFSALHSNVDAIIHSFNQHWPGKDMISFSWLPQYHDMGLIVAIIAPFAAGWSCNMMSPMSFLKNPVLWFDLMSKLKVNWTIAPDFSYRLVARKYKEAQQRNKDVPKLDLSSILSLQNAAEPVRQSTKVLMEETFSEFGLKEDWFHSCYGLAETVVFSCDLHEYKLSNLQPTKGQSLIAVGHRDTMPQEQIVKIVCPMTLQEKNDGEVGEIWLSGPSITAGYFGKSELTKEAFHAKVSDCKHTFLRTGDQGFFEDDYLYICGRLKDLVIVNGVNHYPQDIEAAVESASPAVRPGCVAAFSSSEGGDGDGGLEIVFEVRDLDTHNINEVMNAVQMKVIENIGLVPQRLVAIKERSILKTTSGKIQRRGNRSALHENRLQVVCEFSQSNPTNTVSDNTTSLTASTTVADNDSDMDEFDKIMVSYFGSKTDLSRNWDELGMSSIISVQLRDTISDSFAIQLEPDCFQSFETPALLKDYVLGNQGVPLQIKPSVALNIMESPELSWLTLGTLQVILSVALIFIFACGIVPAWYIGKFFANNASITIPVLHRDINLTWLWAPFTVPTWMFTFSMIVICLKWLVIWKYKEGTMRVLSTAYLRWWFVDRAISLWEFWVGRYVKDTFLINLFYFLMGAKVDMTVSVDAFIREHDLVEVSEYASIEYPVNCHKFDAWNESSEPSLSFRSISIGSYSEVKGMVSPGSSVGNNTCIQKLAVVPEGAAVPTKTTVAGNPAFSKIKMDYNLSSESTKSSCLEAMRGMLKMAWLCFELYLFFASMLLGQYLWVPYLPSNWRYTPVLKWSLLIVWFSLTSIVTSILLKWILIGKRKPGAYTQTLLRDTADWAADWHYRVAVGLLLSFSSHSRIWNIILMLHGMDVDFHSRIVGAVNFAPSQVDLLKVRKSFISGATFSTKSNGRYHRIEIDESSIGLMVHIGPEDLKLSKAIVPPFTHVKKSIINETSDERMSDQAAYKILCHEIILCVGYLISMVAFFFCTLIPAYELWTNVFDPVSVWVAIPALSTSLILQTICWTLLLACVQFVALFGARERKAPWSDILYLIYGTMAFAHQSYSILTVLFGSPAYNFVVKFLGGDIEGQAILFPFRMYEYSLIKFSDRTIIDATSQIVGHYALYDRIIIGPCTVSGVIHQGTVAANALITTDESGPLRGHIGTYEEDSTDNNNLKSVALMGDGTISSLDDSSGGVNNDEEIGFGNKPQFPIAVRDSSDLDDIEV